MPFRQIAEITGSKQTTIKHTSDAYEQFGRTNKLMTMRSKQWLMDQRNKKRDIIPSKEASIKKLFEVTKVVFKDNDMPVVKQGS